MTRIARSAFGALYHDADFFARCTFMALCHRHLRTITHFSFCWSYFQNGLQGTVDIRSVGGPTDESTQKKRSPWVDMGW